MQSKLEGIHSFVLRSSVFQIVGLLKIEAYVIWCLCGVIMEQNGGFPKQSHNLFMTGGVPENSTKWQTQDW